MNRYFEEYLDMSQTGRIEYLKFIIELANFAIRNQDNPQIKRETVEKAYKAKEQAQRQLAEERRQQRERRECGDHSL